MNILQPESLKIRKKVRNCKVGKRTYVCGGCQKAYKSYPALYLHIKLKHDGIKPPNTTCQKPLDCMPPERLSVRLSQLATANNDIDDVDETLLERERAEDDLLRVLGDRMKLLSPLDPKPSMGHISSTISCNLKSTEDEYLLKIQQKVQEFILEEKDITNFDLELFKDDDLQDDMMRLIWFLLWLSRNMTKLEFLGELCFIFSRIWKVISQRGINISYLGEKRVWSEVTKECLKDITKLPHFKGKDALVTDFIKKLCIFIGKSLE